MVNNDFEIIKQAVKKHVPKLAEFIDYNISIKDYSCNLYKVNFDNRYIKRQEIIKKAIKNQCTYLYGEESKNFRLNLDGPVIANIVDHNGILNNPILLSSHLVSSANNIFSSKYDILSINTALYPLNNPFYKRGLTFQKKVIPFVSKSKSHQLVYFSPPLNFINFPAELKCILENADRSKNAYAWDQASRMNYYLWPLLFEENLRSNLPKLITLNQEEIVRELLIDLIKKKNNFIYDLLFKSDFRFVIKNIFEGITGGWSEQKGSFLFWSVDDKNQGVSLKLENDCLVSTKTDYFFKVRLGEEEIINALKEKKIYPGMVLLFGAIVFYAGIVPLAGYGSINYLNDMKEKWLAVLKNNYKDEYLYIKNTQINKLVGGPVLTYYRDKDFQIQQAYMLDIIMNGGLKEKYLNTVFKMKFNDLMLAPLIDIYNSYVPKESRRPVNIKAHDIITKQLAWLR